MKIVAKHAIITDECRSNRGDEAALEEALNRIRRGYLECIMHWPLGRKTEFHLKLEIEENCNE